jgi:hypothetical protein
MDSSSIAGKKRLLDGVTSLSKTGFIAPTSVPSVKVIAGGTHADSLLEEFPELTTPAGRHREVRDTLTTFEQHPAIQ